jgi:hypothetical protein
MVGNDGNNEHRHRLIDFRPLNLTFINRIVIINGMVSLDIWKRSNRHRSYDSNIPMSIRIENIRTISVDTDKKMVDYFLFSVLS